MWAVGDLRSDSEGFPENATKRSQKLSRQETPNSLGEKRIMYHNVVDDDVI